MYLITWPAQHQTLSGSIGLPASKSISNRLLILNALSRQAIPVENLSEADDTRLLRDLLAKAEATHPNPPGDPDAPHGLSTDETGRTPVVLDCRNAGTVLRFLTAFLARRPGTWLLTGSGRMKQRPVGVLVEALRNLGASIEYRGGAGYPPLLISGRDLRGGEVVMDGSVSSQFLSALLMIGPLLPGGLTIRITGRPVSRPYVEMTAGVMKQLGAGVTHHGNLLVAAPGEYHPEELGPGGFHVEADWSSAAFCYEAAALAGNAEILLPGLHFHSLQGDAALAELFRPFGVETTFEEEGVSVSSGQLAIGSWQSAVGSGQSAFRPSSISRPLVRRSAGPPVRLSACPDLAPALIVTYAALGIAARFTGLHHLATKESDRLRALQKELKRIGRPVRVRAPGIIETLNEAPLTTLPKGSDPVCINTYGDHRIAMAFAPLALMTGAICIDEPGVVSKSYPGFWEDLKRMGFRIEKMAK